MKSERKNHLFSIKILMLFLALQLSAQDYFAGFNASVSGTGFSYHSTFSYNEKCLLTRARADFPAIVWKTEKVPSDFTGKSASFIWVYGMGTKKPGQDFDFYVNNEKVLTFSSSDMGKANRDIPGKDGIVLSFVRSMIDRNNDEMGIAVLHLPKKYITNGQSVELKVDGVDNNSYEWYMTFERVLEPGFKTFQLKTVTRKERDLYHTIRFEFMHLKDPTKVTIIGAGEKQNFKLKTGFNELDFNIPKVNQPTQVEVTVKIGKKLEKQLVSLEPVKEWTVNLVQHSHTDIGYTRSQTEILAEHLRFIDSALDYCDQTDSYPEEAKFRWTCEAAWTVREYLKSRPKAQIDRLLRRIKEGRIEVTGMFFNYSEIIDETALAIQTQPIKMFKNHGIDVTTAMQNDVNGIGWAMIDIYKDTGVKYLTMGQHGHRAHVPFDKPTSFWWESNSGNRLLAYRSEHYMHGNALSLTSGEIDQFRANLSNYLDDLDAKDYPYNRTAIQFSGYLTDNSPPSTKACDIVKEWNEKYEWPKLKLTLASEFMEYLETNEKDSLPIQKKAWPDWWTDGFGSAFRETKTARNTHSQMIANTGLLSMALLMGGDLPSDMGDDILSAYDELLFYDEHTFGAAESIRDPLIENSMIQWGQKSAYAWTAFKESSLIQEKALGILQENIPKSAEPTIAVFNTLNWKRSGKLNVYIDHQIFPLNGNYKIVDKDGNTVPAQIHSTRADGSYHTLWAKDVPPLGYVSYRIVADIQKNSPSISAVKAESTKLENDFYRLTIDTNKGVISGLFDKELNKELLDLSSDFKLGEFIYEEPETRESLERLTNASKDTVYVPIKKRLSGLTDIKVSKPHETSLWKSIVINGQHAMCADERGVNLEIRLYKFSKKIELFFKMVKKPVLSPESVFVAFPFALSPQPKLHFDVQGGIVSPGINQLEGTATDWNTVQSFVAVGNKEAQILFSSGDVPLVHLGDINTGRFYYERKPEKSHIYSWVFNNYWTTNFKATQEGEMKWSYVLSSSSNGTKSKATRFGWEQRIPLLSRIIPPGTNQSKTVLSESSLLDFDLPNLLLVSARPFEDIGVILHLRETEGNHAILDVTKLLRQTGAKSAVEVNVLGEEMKELTKPLLIEHYETRFILLKK